MSDTEREREYRLAASECFAAARLTDNVKLRGMLLTRAWNWLDRANTAFARRGFDALIDDFNDGKIRQH